jgi:probable O-glycosylation ligase (exosortase A-associated)
MIFGAMLVLVPLALSNRFVAYLLWGWTAVLTPIHFLYGFMQSVRFSLIFASIALALLFFNKNNIRNEFKSSFAFLIMLAYLVHTMVSIALGYPDNPFNEILGLQFFKSIVFCLVMYWFVDDREKMHAVFIMLALGLGFHGVLEGLKVIASGGGHRVTGVASTIIGDNNHFGVAMVMVVPILFYLYQYSLKRWIGIGFLTALLLTVLSVLGTHSRGGLLALSIVGLWFLLTSRNKFKSLLLVIVSVAIVFALAPESWFSRMETITNAGEDSSFMGRVTAWKISSAIALNNPIFGGGFHALQVQSVWEEFKYSQGFLGFVSTPEPDLRAKAAHSIYFEVLGDMGFLGLVLFVTIFANAIYTRYQIKKMATNLGENYIWAIDKANALMLSIIAYLAGGAGVSLAYFELPFMLVMLMELLRRQVADVILEKQKGEAV